MIDLDALSIYTALVGMEGNERLPLNKDRKASDLPLLYLIGEKKCLFTTEKLVFVSCLQNYFHRGKENVCDLVGIRPTFFFFLTKFIWEVFMEDSAFVF